MYIKLNEAYQVLADKTYECEKGLLDFCAEVKNDTDSRHLSIAITHFETAFMFLRKAITNNYLKETK